ncbi:MAG TPA: dienelactone hydrolase family protein [Acidimicrobiales bacterium]|nr:dienelactone hydrolase family protein [Acidimicrobiales bacterium]
MNEREITVGTQDGEMTTFVAHPGTGGPFPVAVLYMDGIGYREQVKENARRFAKDGYFCVAPDLFYRSGKGITFDMRELGTEGARERMMSVVMSVTPEKVIADTRAVLDAVIGDPEAAQGPKVCVGYCMGARLALHAASVFGDQIVAAACIHPGALVTDDPGSPHHDLATVRGELYVAFAENDQSATAEVVDRFRAEMERLDVRGTVERLPGTAHGFAMGDLPVYQHEAAERHFERTLDLWGRNLGVQPVGG